MKNSAIDVNEAEIFRECFNNWKSRYYLSEKQVSGYIVQLEKIIDKRIKAIVSGKFRAHYRSAAAYAAALGEVKESWGEVNGKERVMQYYRAEFSRYSSFQAELRAFGMADTRKKKR